MIYICQKAGSQKGGLRLAAAPAAALGADAPPTSRAATSPPTTMGSSLLLTLASLLALSCGLVSAATPVARGMKSFGVAVKQAHLFKGVEKEVFNHTLSTGVTHGAMTQAWHAGKPSGVTPRLRIRYYIDGEAEASIDYPLFLAHGQGPAQLTGTNDANPKEQGGTGANFTTPTSPWGNALFGRTHDSGWYNTYLVPFGKSIRITLTDDVGSSSFWYMCRGVENMPLVVAGLQLPPSARLSLQRTTATVKPGTLITFANATGTAGLLRQFNLVVNSSSYGACEIHTVYIWRRQTGVYLAGVAAACTRTPSCNTCRTTTACISQGGGCLWLSISRCRVPGRLHVRAHRQRDAALALLRPGGLLPGGVLPLHAH